MPDRSRADCPGDVGHRASVVVAHPYPNSERGRVAHRPRVFPVVGGAGFHGGVYAIYLEGRVRAEHGRTGVVIREDRGYLVGRAGVQHLLAPRVLEVEFFEYLAFRIGHSQERGSRHVVAIIGEDRVGSGHVKQGHFATAQGEGQAIARGIGQGGDAHLMHGIQHRGHAHSL